MSLRWLVEVRKDAPRWPYLLVLVAVGLRLVQDLQAIGTEGLRYFLWLPRLELSELLIYLVLLLVCLVQIFWPTILGWALTFTPLLVSIYFFGVSDSWSPYQFRTIILVIVSTVVALLFLFRPVARVKGATPIAVAICLVLASALSAGEWYREFVVRPLSDRRPIINFPKDLWYQNRTVTLAGDFEVITHMSGIPKQIQWPYQSGHRFLLADPGERFGDDGRFRDWSVPRGRLIFAGVSKDAVFVYYEGAPTSAYTPYWPSFLEVFAMPSGRPLWEAPCKSRAENLQQLLAMVNNQECRCVPQS